MATNKKREGTSVVGSFPPSVLQEDKATVNVLENGDIMVVSPIMGLSTKQGILILLFTPSTYTMRTP